jgi:hypothetical protein
MHPPSYRHKKAKGERMYDNCYDGFQVAINTTPVLKNPDSMRKLGKSTGLSVSDCMRYVSNKTSDIKKAKREEEQKNTEARLSLLQ